MPDQWFGVGNASGKLYGNRLEIRVGGIRQPDQKLSDVGTRDEMYRALALATGYRGCGQGCDHPACWLPRHSGG